MAARRRIGSVENEVTGDTVVLVAVLAGAYFFVVKPLLTDLGVNPADTSNVDAQVATNPQANMFSPLFQPYVDSSASFNAANGWANNAQQIQAANAQWQAAGSPLTLGVNGGAYDNIIAAENINNAFGYIAHDYDTVNAMFASLASQDDVAYVADYLNVIYGTDLLTLLRDGRWTLFGLKSGIGDTMISTIINHVKSLPV